MSNLKALNNQLEKAKNVKDVFTIDVVADRAIKNYQAATGRKDANNWYQTEVLAMMAIFAEKPDYAKADRMSIWGCLMTAARKGLSIAEGQLDIVPYNKGTILKADPNYRGMRHQLRRMANIKFVSEAQVVLKGDEFEFDKLNNKIIKHVSKAIPKAITLDIIEAAYVRIEFTDSRIVDTVMFHPELLNAKNKSKNTSESGPWNTSPGEMCKKSVVKRAHKIYYEPERHEIADADFKPIEDAGETVDTTHEEVTPDQPEVQKSPAPEPATVQAEVVEPEVVKPATKKSTNMDDFLKE